MRPDLPLRVTSWLTVLFPLWIVLGNGPQDIALSTTAILFLFHSYRTRDWRWTRAPWVRFLFALWGYMTLRGAVADGDLYWHAPALFHNFPFEALGRCLPFGRYGVFAAALAYWILPDPVTRRRCLLSLGIMLTALSADCLLQWVTGTDAIGRALMQDGAGHIRLTGPFKSPMPGIILAWLFFPAAFPLLLTEDATFRRGRALAAGLAFCLLTLASVTFTGERMALLYLLAGWGLALALLPGQKRALFACLLGAGMLLGLLAATNPLILSRQGGSTLNTLSHWSESPYGQLLHTDLLLSARHPIVGAGTNYFRIHCPELYPDATPRALAAVCNIHPHNIYFEWFIDTGIIGFTLYLAFLAALFRDCAKNGRDFRRHPYAVACLIAFFIRVWPFGSSTNFSSPFGAPPFWLVVGMLVFYAAERRRSPS